MTVIQKPGQYPFAFGIDTSHWEQAMNWEVAAAAGATFAYIKATDGLDVDYYFARSWEQSKAAGILRGGFHWFYPGKDPIRQADNFCSRIIDSDLPPVVDVEEKSGIPSASVYSERLLSFIYRVEYNLKLRPVIYTGYNYWTQFLKPGPAIEWADKYPLWVANYRDTNGPLVPSPWAPTNWTFWQFSAKGPAYKYGVNPSICKELDLDVFNGSYADLLRWKDEQRLS